MIEHQLVFPVEQAGALALTLRGDILRHRKEPIRFFRPGVALIGTGIRLAHDLHGEIHHLGDQADHIFKVGTVKLGLFPHQADKPDLEQPCPAQDQMDGHINTGVHIADQHLLGDALGVVAIGLHRKHAGDPALHGGVQARLNVFVGQEDPGARRFQHVLVEGRCQPVAVAHRETADPLDHLGGKTLYQL